jgi:hypothetical protein
LFDAEHFFDGFKANPDYAIKSAKAAYDAGARWGRNSEHQRRRIALPIMRRGEGPD